MADITAGVTSGVVEVGSANPGPGSPAIARTTADSLLALAGIARFEWDLASGRWTWAVAPIRDEALAAIDHVDALLRLCHPSDIERLRRHLRDRHPAASSEFRLPSGHGTWRWHALCGRVVDIDPLGDPRRFAGLVQDIDERCRAMQVRGTRDALFAEGPVRLCTLGADAGASTRSLYADLAMLLSGGQPGEASPGPPRRLRDVVHPDDAAVLQHGVEAAQALPGTPAHADLRVTDRLGGWRRVRVQLVAEPESAVDPGAPVPTPSHEGVVAGVAATADVAHVPVMHAYLLDTQDLVPRARDGALAEATDAEDDTDRRLDAVVAQLGTMQRFLADLQRLNEMLQACDGEAQAREVVEQVAASLFPGWTGSVRLSDAEDGDGRLVAWGEDDAPDRACHRIAFPLVVGTQHGVLELLGSRTLDDAALRHATWAAASFAEALGLSLGNVRLREQAVQDWLTGLYNRRWFDEALRRESRRAQRSGEGVTLALLEIDHFGSFTDAFGHEAGDEMLRAVAHELQAFGRSSDTPCRIGDEQMAVLMPRARIGDACDRLEALRARIAALRVVHEGVALPPVTVSIGVADDLGDPGALDGRAGNLQRRTEIALHTARRDGRDRVRCWDAGMDDVSGLAPLDTRPSTLGL